MRYGPILEIVALADGAEENWRCFERPVYDKATGIVDHGHASPSASCRWRRTTASRASRNASKSSTPAGPARDQLAVLMTLIAALSRLAPGTRE